MNGKTYVAMILDKSGSMLSLRESAVKSFNDQIKSLKRESEKNNLETVVSIVLFNHEISVQVGSAEVGLVNELKEETYQPSGMTALYDAIGQTIHRFEKNYELGKEDAVLFVIVTDGMENSSQEFGGERGRKNLKSEIERLENTKQWTFTFIGTENALDQALDIGIASTLQYDASDVGLDFMAQGQTRAFATYFNSRASGETSVKNLYDDIDAVEPTVKEDNEEKPEN